MKNILFISFIISFFLGFQGVSLAQNHALKENLQTTSQNETHNPELPSQRLKPPTLLINNADLSPAIAENTDKILEEIRPVQENIEKANNLLSQENVNERALIQVRDRLDENIITLQEKLEIIQPALNSHLENLKKFTNEQAQDTIKTKASLQEQSILETKIQKIEEATRPAEALITRIAELQEQIIAKRRELLTERLLNRQRTILEPVLWIEATQSIPSLLGKTTSILSDWWGLVQRRAGLFTGLLMLASMIGVMIAMRPLRRKLLAITRRANQEEPERFHCFLGAAWIAISDTLIVLICLSIIYATLTFLDVLPPLMSELYRSVGFGALLFSFSNGLLRTYIAPYRPKWRLLNLDDTTAERLMAIAGLTSLFYVMTFITEQFLNILSAPITLIIIVSVIGAVITAVLILICTKIISQSENENPSEEEGERSISLWRFINIALFFSALSAFAASLLGYITLGNFILWQTMRILLLIASLYIMINLIDSSFMALSERHAKINKWAQKALGLAPTSLRQISVLFSGILRLLLTIILLIAIFAPFGIETRNFFSALKQGLTGFQIGNISISLTGIITAILIFTGVLMITRSFQRWLEQKYLPNTRLDDGLKVSIKTTIGYIGFIIAAMIGFSYMGLNLENIAIVAGALSVGIGFGLQSIVSNFVSGLILLAERPFKAGDWVVVGGEEGIVRKVSVRATEVETFDKATVIVPNSDFISGTVKNWVHGTRLGRISVIVGVSYASDPEKIRTLLLDVANNHPLILSSPEPRVIFLDFGASSLDFELQAFLPDIQARIIVTSDLRYAVFKKFKEHKIEIPFPQSDIHFRDMERIEHLIRK